MSTDTQTKTSNKPTHAIYQVIGDDDHAKWLRVGTAWMHKDQKGASLKFDSFPLSGRTVLREIKETDNADGKKGGAS